MAATTTNFGPHTVIGEDNSGGLKRRIVTSPGPASYTTGGGEFDCSSNTTDGMGTQYDALTVVYSIKVIGLAPAGTASNSKYKSTYLPATAYAAATGLLKLEDMIQATPAEATSSGDLSAIVFLIEVVGR